MNCSEKRKLDAEKAARWRRNNPERAKEVQKDYEARYPGRKLALRKVRKAANPEKTKDQQLKYRYGISLMDYKQLLEQQDFRCAICGLGSEELARGLMVDHCHVTEKVRGLLCDRCNTGLGKFRDSLDLIKRAEQYLETRNLA